MKRPFTLTGFVVATLMQIAYICYALHTLTIVIDIMTTPGVETNGAISLAVVTGLEILFAVVSMIFNAISIRYWNKSSEIYHKKRWIMLTAIALNLASIILVGISLGLGVTNSLAMSICEIVILVGANALVLYDFLKEKKRY